MGRPERLRDSDPVVTGDSPDDVWSVIARARDGGSPHRLAAARDAVFRSYLPMARTLADAAGGEILLVDPVTADQAAELGLAQAVLGWRRPDGRGFELFASIAVAAQLDRIPR